VNDTFKETLVYVRLHTNDGMVIPYPIQVFTEHDPAVLARLHVLSVFKEDE